MFTICILKFPTAKIITILDAEEFYDPQYNKINYTGSLDPRFIKKREILREFLKSKDKRHKRDVGKKMFSRKLGGTHNNEKSQKVKHGKSTNKFRGKINVKSKKNGNIKKLNNSKWTLWLNILWIFIYIYV